MSDDEKAEAECRDYHAELAEKVAYRRGSNDALDAVLEMFPQIQAHTMPTGAFRAFIKKVQQLRGKEDDGK